MKKLVKKSVTVLTVIAIMVLSISATALAATPVAKIGSTEYDTLADAVAAVADGGEIQLLATQFDQNIALGRVQKSFTLIGADNYGTVFTAGLQIGTDNSTWPILEHTITVKNIYFKNKSLSVCDYRNVNIIGNKFEDIANTEPAAIRIIDPAIDGIKASAVVSDNIIDKASQGIRIRTGYNITITGNTVKNTQHNAITIEHNSNRPANDGKVVIEKNTFENWALGGDGRVVRGTFGPEAAVEKEIIFNENKMLCDNEPAEEYAKITSIGTTTVNLEKNYWNSDEPDFDTILTVTGGNAEANVTEYYKAKEMKAEDLNTYVAPPANEENNAEEKADNKTEEPREKETNKDGYTSPATGDNSTTLLAVLMFSGVALTFCVRKARQCK